MVDLNDRVRQLNRGEENRRARYILYWMQVYKRPRYNHALSFAIRAANERRLPLVVYEGLKYNYPWANDRLHTFILQGVNENRREFQRLGIRYVFYLQKNERDPRDTVARLAEEAALLVTDDFPCFIIPEHNRRIAARVRIPVFAVDSNGLVPLSAFAKEEYAARTIRPKIKRLLPRYFVPFREEKVAVEDPHLRVNCPEETVFEDGEIGALVARCAIDHNVAPSPVYRGGRRAGLARLQHFVEKILPRYHEQRTHPETDGTSRLSSYLHFGYLSAQEIAEAVQVADAPQQAKEAYLEELIVRRELAYNFTRFNPRYASLEALPDWAKRTLGAHDDDPRPTIISPAQIEEAQTYDELWNATQRELLWTGEIHNYVRMLWGKKVIEWRPTHDEAFHLLEHLNNKYALDGRDPNSYAGILWCFGKHDRPWGPESPIFGLVRRMSSQSMGRKFNARKYIEWTRSFEPDARQSVERR